MAKSSDLRREIQALRNQAKARGHKNVKEEEVREKAFVYNEGLYTRHTYVYKDLAKTFLFLLFALTFLFIASLKLSSLPIFFHLREDMHISSFSF